MRRDAIEAIHALGADGHTQRCCPRAGRPLLDTAARLGGRTIVPGTSSTALIPRLRPGFPGDLPGQACRRRTRSSNARTARKCLAG